MRTQANLNAINLADHLGCFVNHNGQEWMLVHVDLFEQSAVFENEGERHIKLTKAQAIDLILSDRPWN